MLDKHMMEYMRNLHSIGINGSEDGDDGLEVADTKRAYELGLCETVSAVDVMSFCAHAIEQEAELTRLRAEVDRLPVYVDTGKAFVPRRDPCFVIFCEVAWADGEHGLTTESVVATDPTWCDESKRWLPGQRGFPGDHCKRGFYSTREAASQSRKANHD